MNRTAISNISELRSEINRLRIIDDEQSLALKHRFNSPSAVLASVLTLFPKSAAARSITDHGIFHPDLLSLASRFLIPITLNKTLFRHSNFLVKLMVGYASQKVSPYVTEENIERFAVVTKSTLANLFNKKRQQKNHVAISSP
ncbi:hypothetical protein AAFN85_23110 [Mucilaginibacter sp. CAU 1740]|uniref:hypothetical protein n=1 Tax=Mucilaginibacter sp. CAU 1740 TaxID=3140365 RepID=UPI00325B6176